ncbi:MAG: hypothetical protein LC541_14925 [Candidatus Thiodiazotropha sp.]|nr:hypothetical protein [Candidatus Thiodiazotropha sp.]
MLNRTEKREFTLLLKKKNEPAKAMTEGELLEIEDCITAVHDRRPDVFSAGKTAWRNICGNLDILGNQNDRLVQEVRRLQMELTIAESMNNHKDYMNNGNDYSKALTI